MQNSEPQTDKIFCEVGFRPHIAKKIPLTPLRRKRQITCLLGFCKKKAELNRNKASQFGGKHCTDLEDGSGVNGSDLEEDNERTNWSLYPQGLTNSNSS